MPVITKGDRWSLKYDHCVFCKTTDKAYAGKGMCYVCYGRAKNNKPMRKSAKLPSFSNVRRVYAVVPEAPDPLKVHKCDNLQCPYPKERHRVDNMCDYKGKHFCTLGCVNAYATHIGIQPADLPVKPYENRSVPRDMNEWDMVNEYMVGT